MSFSENAILTRSRAIYSKRLTDRNYKDLLNCSGVEEAADYLSTKTQYFETFVSFTSAKINRMMLESLLKRNYVGQFSALYSFSKIIGNETCRYFVMVNEITLILSCLRYVLAPNKLDIFVSLPSYENMSPGFDVMSVANSEDFSEMLSKLKKTEYYEALKKLDGEEKPNVLKIENALYGYLDKKICEIAKKSLSKDEYKKVYEMVAFNSDLKFISKVMRLKRTFNFSPEEIIDCGFSFDASLLSKDETQSIISAKDADELVSEVGKTVYGKGGDLHKIKDVDLWSREIKFEKYSKEIMYSTCPNVVMMCCFFLKEIEIRNITSIIEGKKYGLEPGEIEKHLVGYKS